MEIKIEIYCEKCHALIKESYVHIKDKEIFMVSAPPCTNCEKLAFERGQSKGYREGVKKTQQKHKSGVLNGDLKFGHFS